MLTIKTIIGINSIVIINLAAITALTIAMDMDMGIRLETTSTAIPTIMFLALIAVTVLERRITNQTTHLTTQTTLAQTQTLY
jgi:hypothetical protein